MQYNIYGLIDPSDGKIKYVGATMKKCSDRLRQHVYDSVSLRKQSAKCKWIRQLKLKGREPVVCLLHVCNKENWKIKERYYIELFQTEYNTASGGTGMVLKRSKESIRRSADAHKIKIMQLDKYGNFIKEWDSVKEAANFYKTTSTNISNVLNGVNHTAKGFIWVKKENYSSDISFRKKKGSTPCKAVKGGIVHYFDTIKACAKHFNRAGSGISRQLNDKGYYVIDGFKIVSC